MARVNLQRAALLSMVALLLGVSTTASAQTKAPAAAPSLAAGGVNAAPPVPAPIVMIVDFEGIMAVSKAGKSIQTQLDTQRSSMQKEISQRENDLRNEEQELTKQRPTMAADAFEAKARDFQQKVAAYQRETQLRDRALSQGFGEAKQKLQQALAEVVQQLTTERGANLVLYKSQVFLYETSYDASQEALKRLDVKLPAVTVTVPKLSDVAGGQAPAAAPASAPATPAAPAKKK
ncbi:MAG TPA: OmpH family outer membrane protein [Aliidongia sp.]|uniref:OmpH family outer membrane protein n=1 Tax=Aliidongia sp. TaxID=1914230 RepID=UPI002DDD57E5|nr:OmpH family outer membrane protein [Aliidongia sp.]HEV2678499.1 OmpH family outer membrane protein [Aliidongia sp.]